MIIYTRGPCQRTCYGIYEHQGPASEPARGLSLSCVILYHPLSFELGAATFLGDRAVNHQLGKPELKVTDTEF